MGTQDTQDISEDPELDLRHHHYAHLSITRDGRVYSWAHATRGTRPDVGVRVPILKTHPHPMVWCGHKGDTSRLAPLVLEVHRGRAPLSRAKYVHLDGDRQNCHVDNLAWLSSPLKTPARVPADDTGEYSEMKAILRARGRRQWIDQALASVGDGE